MVALAGCSMLMRGTPTPIATLERPASANGRTKTLVVCLPGRGDTMADYEREGIVEIMRKAGVMADAVIVDAHMGYYYKQTVVDRLYTDVLAPARRNGYRRIVLVGVSLGGLGGMLCERDRPGSIDTLVLLGPFLGEDDHVFNRIASAGGPAAWAADRPQGGVNIEEKLWTFIGKKSATLPETWLFSGREDKYARGQQLFAKLLPANRVKIIEGTHDWPTWRTLWRDACLHSTIFQAERTGTPAPKEK